MPSSKKPIVSKIDKEMQVRRTYEDTIRYQQRLEDIVRQKYYQNDFIHIPEEKEYMEIISKAYLTQGMWRLVYYEDGTNKIPLGNLHSFSINLGRIKRKTVKITRYSYSKNVPISELWLILFNEFPYIFPLAQKLAYQSSVEGLMRESAEPFEFSSKEHI